MISLLFWCLAAACCAVMDTLDHHIETSVFAKWAVKPHVFPYYSWFYTRYSWVNKYIDRNPGKGKIKWFWGLIDKPVFLTDAWHLSKSLMIVFICISIVTFKPYFNFQFIPIWLQFVLHIASYGLWWNAAFNLFYNHILIKKK